MREIKFRAWDKDLNEMHTKNIIVYNGKLIAIECNVDEPIEDVIDEPTAIIHPNWELMQFTGLKDKNGKEVYESDILEMNKHIYEVYWESTYGRWCLKRICAVIEQPYWDKSRVIGNIYENQELVRSTK